MTIQPEIQPCCGNCRFSTPAVNNGKINFKQRICKRNPPAALIVPGPQGPLLQSMWPSLDITAHCFSHEPMAVMVLEPPLPGEIKPETEQ